MPRLPEVHHYLIKLEHSDGAPDEEICIVDAGMDRAIAFLETTTDKRRAFLFEDGEQIAEMVYLDGFWRVA